MASAAKGLIAPRRLPRSGGVGRAIIAAAFREVIMLRAPSPLSLSFAIPDWLLAAVSLQLGYKVPPLLKLADLAPGQTRALLEGRRVLPTTAR
jgi:hypothetical protein